MCRLTRSEAESQAGRQREPRQAQFSRLVGQRIRDVGRAVVPSYAGADPGVTGEEVGDIAADMESDRRRLDPLLPIAADVDTVDVPCLVEHRHERDVRHHVLIDVVQRWAGKHPNRDSPGDGGCPLERDSRRTLEFAERKRLSHTP